MNSFQTILFAADFSENSREAFSAACSLARADKSRVVVLHIADSDWVASEPVYANQTSVQFDEKKPDERRLHALEQKLRDTYAPAYPIDVEYCARAGDISDQIVEMARELSADLIVMGSHGRTGMNWILFGSVAARVLRKASCPVLALKYSTTAPKLENARLILHPTDFSENSRAALGVARSLALDLGARLLILHVSPPAILLDGTNAGEVDPSVFRASLEELRDRLDGPDLKFPVETRFAPGFEREEILRTAQEIGCDLIVMGTHGRTGLSGLLMGSVAETVLSRASCPVMVVKAPKHVTAPKEEKSTARKTVTVL
jgi:nucleotide-binding universal stress UspA family protein